MARPKNPPYTLGRLAYADHPTDPSARIVRGYYTDRNNKRVDVTARGKTDAAALRALHSKVNKARDSYTGGDGLIRHDTKLSRAAEIWLDWKFRQRKSGAALTQATMHTYASYVEHSIKRSSIASLSLVDANDVSRIEAWLSDIADTRGETAAKQSRKVLSGILGLAERRGAIPASVLHRVQTPGATAGSAGDNKCTDQDCDFDCGKRHLDTKRAFTPDEAAAVQEAADLAKADVGDLAAFLFGTGTRIAEALHCVAWEDVDLDEKTVHVRGTKTAQADRVLEISDDLADRLRARAEMHGEIGQVFGITYFTSKLGQPRDKNNVGRAMRQVFDSAGVRWAGTHTFRRTVATWMDEDGAPLAEIANQLGHADINVTATYLGRKKAPTRAARVMVLPSKPALRVVPGSGVSK